MNGLQEANYVEALKRYQKDRLDHLRQKADIMRLYLDSLRSNVVALETQRRRRHSDSDRAADWRQISTKLREDNRTLHIDCNCLTVEVDLYASGRIALGVTDENFYRELQSLRANGPSFAPNSRPGIAPPIPQRPYPVQRMPDCVPHPLHTVRYSYQQVYCPSLAIGGSFGNYGNSYGNNYGNSLSGGLLSQVPPTPTIAVTGVTPRHRLLPRTPHTSPQALPPTVNNTYVAPPLPPRSDRMGSPRPIRPAPEPPVIRSNNSTNNSTDDDEDGQRWVCPKCTVENHSAMTYCEVCEMPRNVRLIDVTDGTPEVTHISLNTSSQSGATPERHSSQCYCHECHHLDH